MSDVVIYCPECKAEYREGFTICSDCDVPLVSTLDADFEDPLVPLVAHAKSAELVAELLDRLEKDNVPYVIQAGTALAAFDDPASEIAEPQPWEARIWVTTASKQLAGEILQRLRDEHRSELAAQRWKSRSLD